MRPQLREIPAVDVPETGPLPAELVGTVGQALEEIGFLFVRAPHIAALLPGVYAGFRSFFSLPLEVRMKYAFPEIFYERGYTPRRTEEALFCRKMGPGGTPLPDEKECYMIGPEVPENEALLDTWGKFHRPNVWPTEAPELEGAMHLLYSSLYPIGQKVLRVLVEVLEKPADFFDEMLRDGPTVMRALHYPPLSAEEVGKVVWGCAHTDINLVTVLPASTRNGLWIRLRRSKDFIPGRAPEGCVLVQTGDMLKTLTDGRIASAVHEVRAPTEPTTEGRYSAALFMHPRSDVPLKGAKTTGQFLEERLRAIGLY
jgi:isopenicillin N synthase-like dioxygenase